MKKKTPNAYKFTVVQLHPQYGKYTYTLDVLNDRSELIFSRKIGEKVALKLIAEGLPSAS